MEYPMRKYGRNIYENFLSSLLNITSLTTFIFAVLLLCFRHSLISNGDLGYTLITAALLLSALLTGITSTGVRQNKAFFELAWFCTLLTGVAGLAFGIFRSQPYLLIGGSVLIIIALLLLLFMHHAVAKRFNPRFFSRRQFETMIQIADTMLDSDGKAALNPIEVAVNTDHLLSNVESPAVTKDMKMILFLVEWILPLIRFRPFPFSSLGSEERRKLIEQVIGGKGIFRNIAKALKVLFCMGYYGDMKSMRQTGYIPFEERSRSSQDQTPLIHTPPTLKEAVTHEHKI